MLLGTLIDVTGAGWGRTPTDDRVVDRETAQRMAEGNPEALAAVYDRHIRLVFGLAMRVLQDQGDAEDVVQEVFSQAWTQAKRYDATRGSVASWLLMMSRSRAIDRLRSRRAKPDSAPLPHDTAVVDLPDPAQGAEHGVLTAESASGLRVALADSGAQRERERTDAEIGRKVREGGRKGGNFPRERGHNTEK